MTGAAKRGVSALGSLLLTLFGLTVLTFFIGRVMPTDPVLAAVGDNAPQSVVERARAEMGLDSRSTCSSATISTSCCMATWAVPC